jgi:carbon storage regulator
MLVLSRRLGESIVLPDCQATVTVVGVYGNRVRLGITAPHDVCVHRSEVGARVSVERLKSGTTAILLDGEDTRPPAGPNG